VIAAPPGYSGANALAPSVMMSNDDTTEFPPVQQTGMAQPTLFANYLKSSPNPGPNVIPFDRRERQSTARQTPVVAAPQHRVSVRKPSGVLSNVAPDAQGTLDFVPAAPVKGRTLKTTVEAQVFCGQPVATPTHRLVASAIDGVIILFGFGLLIALFEVMGGRFGAGKALWVGLSMALALVSMFYGLIWAIAGRETAGMRLTDLQLITFDGFQVDPRSRALRFASTWLSFCSGGLGLLWAVADEENLTWHDHISKTFPTIREVPGTFVKQRL
jgi:uncharacterized RDD family membrane protein YckC